ncbi:response regulator protein [Rhizobium phaseoli]|uniref:helix-turn-helix transcriptional regulator n=1 Tax=Rhizobium phaseoli TaxID=396 RepID=UPI0007E9FC87|nr:LuxR C-terminal-related transcriptional regulator [Rhizobium phaseoli]ANL47541.1 response regulator protein [Rhizobium phaseoli]
MKTRKGFTHASREMWDAWISSDADTLAEQICRPALRLFTASMVLAVQEREKCLILRGYEAFAEHALIANDIACERLVLRHHETQMNERPVSTKEMIAKEGMLAAFESLLLPQKGGGWCLAVIDIQLLLSIPRTRPDIDDVDRVVLQLLCAGFSGKEIGQHLRLSHRTVEHRIERLKKGFDARSIAQLVALSIADGLRSSG